MAKRRELWIVAGFTALLFLPFIGKAYHVDEPYFLMGAEQVLRDPLHPDGFATYLDGRKVPHASVNAHPVFLSYLLAAGLKLTGGREWAMRLLFLPFDVLAACGLYLLAARFLARPLWPTLIALAGPGFLLNVPLLTAEKWLGACGFWALYALARAVDDEDNRWERILAALLAASMLIKYSAIFLFITTAVYWLGRGRPPRRLALLLGLAAVPFASYLGWQWALAPEKLRSITPMVSSVHAGLAGRVHTARALLAFTGGLGVVGLLWPLIGSSSRRSALAALGTAFVLSLPALDLFPVFLPDRLLGAAFILGGARALWAPVQAWRERRPGGLLWLSWAGSVALLQAGVYWCVTSRYALFIALPTTLALAQALEARLAAKALLRVHAASLAAVLGLSLSLAAVDHRYAAVQKEMAARLAPELARGVKVWFTGKWGFQWYMERAGAVGVDIDRGAWDALARGDMAVIPKNNTSLRPVRPIAADLERVTVGHPVPLRLIGMRHVQAGFYAAVWSFLPYTVSAEPVEVFDVLRRK